MFRFIFYFFTIILLLPLNLKSQSLQINEVVSKNYNGLESFENKTEDWIELYNNSNDTIQLQNYYLSDDENNLYAWQLPNQELFPDSFLIVFASDENLYSPELHTNFKLKSEGEKLFLSSSNIVDSITTPNLKTDYSFGRENEQSNIWFIIDIPSPNESNALSNHLSFSHESGFYDDEFILEVSSLKPGHTIYYTTDGSEPNLTSKIYNPFTLKNLRGEQNKYSAIITTANHPEIKIQHKPPNGLIEKASILKFASYKGIDKTSKTIQKTYFINSIKYNLPVISIVADSNAFFNIDTGIYIAGNHWDTNDPSWTGNYAKRGKEWERKVNISFFDLDKSLVFEQKAGARIHGGLTRTKPQKSLRLYARNQYGENKFKIPFFEDFTYDKFILKNVFAPWNGSLISDFLALKSAEKLNLEQQHFNPVILFLNGEYWGLHFLGERIDDDFLYENQNLDKTDSLNLLAQSKGHPQNGDNYEFKLLVKFIEENDLRNDNNFNYVSEKIDIENFINYHIVEMFFNNIDWPENNIKFWNINNSKWRYVLFDLDGGTSSFGYTEDYNMFEHMMETNGPEWPNPPHSNFIFRNLIKNENFKTKFVTNYIQLLENELSTVNLKENLNKIIALLAPNINDHIKRWNSHDSYSDWEYIIQSRTLEFIEKRQCEVNDQMIKAFKLEQTNYICEENDYDLDFIIYPNPTNNIINVKFLNPLNQPSYFNYQITDGKGSIIKRGNKLVIDEAQIYLDNLSKGLYFFQITHLKNKPVSNKFIVE